jgi:hypothetical protein
MQIKKDKKVELLTQGLEFKSKAEQGRLADQIEKEVADKLQLLFDGLAVGESVQFAGLKIEFKHVEARPAKDGEITKKDKVTGEKTKTPYHTDAKPAHDEFRVKLVK